MQISKNKAGKDASSFKKIYPVLNKVHSFLDCRYLSILSLLWLIEKFVNYKLWVSHTNFPTVPVADVLLKLPPQVQNILLYASLMLMGVIIIQPKIKWTLPALLVIEICACMLDQNRWNPWEYEFVFIIAIHVVHRKNKELLQAALLFLLSGTYFYSGIHKLNKNFLYFDYTGIMHSLFRIPVHIIHQRYIYRGGYLIALFEAMLGLGLLFPATQKRNAQCLVLMHIIIATCILQNPNLYKYSLQIVPWNLVNLTLLYVFFIMHKSPDFHLKWLTAGVNPLVILCFCVLPALSFWGLWESELSMQFYSGKMQPRLVLCITDTSNTPEMRTIYAKHEQKVCKDASFVMADDWAFEAIDVRVYPEKRVLKKVKEFFIATHPNTRCSFYLVPFGVPPTKPPIPF